MSHYARGASFERTVADDLRKRGGIVYRSAGSHGAADLIWLRAGRAAVLVQAKINGRCAPAERRELDAEARSVDALALVADRPARGRIRYRGVLLGGTLVEVQVENLEDSTAA